MASLRTTGLRQEEAKILAVGLGLHFWREIDSDCGIWPWRYDLLLWKAALVGTAAAQPELKPAAPQRIDVPLLVTGPMALRDLIAMTAGWGALETDCTANLILC